MIKKKDFKKNTNCIVAVGNLPAYLYRCCIVRILDNNYCVVKLEPYNSGYKSNLASKHDGYHIVHRSFLYLDNGQLDFAYDHDNILCDYNVVGGIY